MKRILIPTDFSEMAQNALEYGVELARRSGAGITLMHSVQKPISPPQGPVRDRSEIPEENEEALALWEELEGISKWVREGHPEIQEVSERMPSGFPGDEIIKTVKEGSYDLIVMGTKGEKWFSDTLMGTTASNVLQKAPCNVLLVPEKARYKKIQTAAYASALHEKDPQAVRELMDFLGQRTEIRAVHVLGKGEELSEDEQEVFRRRMEKVGTGAPSVLDVARGDRIEKALDDYVRENGVDLVAMLNESRNFIQRLFQESRSKRMAFHTSVPLLVMHAS